MAKASNQLLRLPLLRHPRITERSPNNDLPLQSQRHAPHPRYPEGRYDNARDRGER